MGLKKQKKVYGKKALLSLMKNPTLTLSSDSDSDSDSGSNSNSESEFAELKKLEQKENDKEPPKKKRKKNPSPEQRTEIKKTSDTVVMKRRPPSRTNQKVLMCASRGITHRFRHLFSDIISLLPHSYKENKLDTKKQLSLLNELAELSNCTKVLYFESRHVSDQYLWMAHAPNGPSVKFEVTNVHTMDELNLLGNHLKGSRSLLSFDASFNEVPHLKVIKELWMQIFNVPLYTKGSKPFFDHVLTVSYVDETIWFRNYQIPNLTLLQHQEKEKEEWLEVGPRFVLIPLMVFQGSFQGLCLWKRPDYLTPATRRRLYNAEIRGSQFHKANLKFQENVRRKENVGVGDDPTEEVFRDVNGAK